MAQTQILSIIHRLVPASLNDPGLEDELMDQCRDIINSKIGQNKAYDLTVVENSIKRLLTHHPPASISSGTAIQRLINLTSRLVDQHVLQRPEASLAFLHSLASSNTSALPSLPILEPVPRPSPSSLSNGSRKQTQTQPPPSKLPPSGGPTGNMSKAEMLREFRAKLGRPHLPEHLLLRDALYLLQGISGKFVRLSKPDPLDGTRTVTFVEDSEYIISPPTRELIHRLSEVGHLYSRVSTFVQERDNRTPIGLIEQSLCHHLQSQLTEYYRLVAILESQMSFTPQANPRTGSGKENEESLASGSDLRSQEIGLTLARLEVWIDEWRLRLRMMSTCVEGCKTEAGGALVSLIHGYTDNGDPFVRHFTDQLLEEVSKPFFATLYRWLYSGDLRDPFKEFFVEVDPELADQQYVPANSSIDIGSGLPDVDLDVDGTRSRGTSGLQLWKGKYKFRKGMLPRFVEEGFAQKIFSTGKSLNFIRYSCHDSDWVATRNKLSNNGQILKYSDIAGLEQSIDKAYQIASQRLFDVFFDKFRLLDHMRALKNYLLLGHGDFAEHLMEALAPNLGRPANVLLRHHLTSTLETAIRATNAQFDPPDVLRRLDARIMGFSHGEIGWDVFKLEYKVDAPIDTVLDPDCMIKYGQLFNHLWYMKRVDGALSTGWMRLTSASKIFAKMPELEKTFHLCRIKMAEMIFFMRQMQSYCQLSVIEVCWRELMEFVSKKEGDLDSLIDAHRAYLDKMVDKVFLTLIKNGKRENTLHEQVKEVFRLVISFREAAESLYNICLAESARRDATKDTARGVFTSQDPTREAASQEAVNRIKRRIAEFGVKVSSLIKTIVLSLHAHPESGCKYLALQMSFNDFSGYKRDSSTKSEIRGAATV